MKDYILLTKPGIILGNILTFVAGFVLAPHHEIGWLRLFTTLLGLSLIIASACVFNNTFDRNMDAKMSRTQTRALAVGRLSIQEAISFGSMLLFLGVFILGTLTNLLTLTLAMLGFAIYVCLYTPLKALTPHATLIGSIAGAMPPLVGYASAAGQLTLSALLFFLIIVLWQMPHFYAIAIYRLEDYSAASIPLLPLTNGIYATKVQTLLYAIAYCIVSLLPVAYGNAGLPYLAVMGPIGLFWISLCAQGFSAQNDPLWARAVFRFSLVVVLALSLCYVFFLSND